MGYTTNACLLFSKPLTQLHRVCSYLECRYLPVSQRLVRRTMLRKLISYSKFYSHITAETTRTIASIANSRVLSGASQDIVGILDKLEDIVKCDDFTKITFHPVFDECIRVLPYMKEEEYSKFISVLLVMKSKFNHLYVCDDKMIHISEHLDPILRNWLQSYPREKIPKLLKFSEVLIGRPSFTFDVIRELKKALKWPTSLMLRFIEHMNNKNMWRVYYVDKYSIEYAFLKHFPHLHMNEAAIMLQAMDKLNMTLSTPELPRKLLELFLDQYRSAESPTITIFLKFFSRLDHCFRNDRYDVNSLLPCIVQVVNEHVDSWSFGAIIHAASFFKKTVCYDPIFFGKLARRMTSDDVLLLKICEIDQLIATVAFFDAKSDYEKELLRLIEKLKTDPLYSILKSHPKRLVSIMYSLSKVGIYDEYFLHIIMSSGFLLDTYKKLDPHYVSMKVYLLDRNAETEYSDYVARPLDETLKRDFERLWCSKMPKLLAVPQSSEDNNHYEYCKKITAHQRLIHEMRSILERLLGEECLLVCATDPQTSSFNIIFALQNGVPQKLDQVIRQNHRLHPHILDDSFSWYAFMFLASNNLPPNEPLLLHNYITHCRLLTKMGIRLIPFITKNWNRMDDHERTGYLKHLIFGRHQIPTLFPPSIQL